MPFIVVRIATIRSSRQTRGSRCRSGCSCMLIAAMRGRHIPAPRSCLFLFLPQPPWHRMFGRHDMVRTPICQRMPWLELWRHGDFTLQHPMFRWRMDDGRGRSPATALQGRTRPQHNRREESLYWFYPIHLWILMAVARMMYHPAITPAAIVFVISNQKVRASPRIRSPYPIASTRYPSSHSPYVTTAAADDLKPCSTLETTYRFATGIPSSSPTV